MIVVFVNAHLRQQIGVANAAICEETCIAYFTDWAQAPIDDPHIRQALPKTKLAIKGAKNWTVLT